MLEHIDLEDAKPIRAEVVQMYDYVKLSFFLGMPFDAEFTIKLSDNDIDKIVELLKQAKQARPR